MKGAFFILLAVTIVTACARSSAPASPAAGSPAGQASMTGTWSGDSSDSTGQQSMTWSVTQDGSSVTGKASVSDTARAMVGTGSMHGTMNGRTMNFHMDVVTGAFTGMMSSCAMGMDGQATMSDDGHTMMGTYGGNMSGMMTGAMANHSCGGPMNNGRFTLTR